MGTRVLGSSGLRTSFEVKAEILVASRIFLIGVLAEFVEAIAAGDCVQSLDREDREGDTGQSVARIGVIGVEGASVSAGGEDGGGFFDGAAVVLAACLQVSASPYRFYFNLPLFLTRQVARFSSCL